MSRSFNANFITEKNKRAGAKPTNLMTFGFSTPVYLSDRDIAPSGGSAHLGLIKKWGFIDSSIQQTSGQDLLGKIEQCDLEVIVINSTSTRFSSYFTTADPIQGVDVTLYQWFDGLLYSEKETLFKGTIYGSPEYDLYECRLIIRGIWEKYNKVIGEDLIVNVSDYPDAEPSDIGKMLPLAWGTCTKVPFRGIEVGAVTTLVEDVDDAAVTFEVTDSSRFDAPGTALIGSEYIYYTDAANNQITGITRGYRGSTPAAHDYGAIINEVADKFIYAIGCPVKSIDIVYIKDRESGLYIRRQANSYYSYTGQTGDEHTTYGGKGIIEFINDTTIPENAIIPFNDTSLPSGWEWFTDANGKLIVGAGDTYSSTDTGGDISHSYTCTSVCHGGDDAHTTTFAYAAGSGGNTIQGLIHESRCHSHEVSFSYLPEYQTLKFIRAVSDRTSIPEHGVILKELSSNPDSGSLSRAFNSNKFLGASSTIGTGGGSMNSRSASTVYDHLHYASLGGPGSGDIGPLMLMAGQHSHATPWAVDDVIQNIKRSYLAAYEASADYIATGYIIVMWESSTPPDGWVLCDGNNNSPDLRNYFIVLSDDGNLGTQTGDNTIEFDITLSTTGNHTHVAASNGVCDSTDLAEHPSHADFDHNHGAKNDTISYTPTYYALTFIMKKPIDIIQGDQVAADIDGYQDDGSGTYTGTPSAIIERPDHFFKHVWVDLLSASAGDINTTNFTTAGSFYNTNSYAISLVVQNLIQANQLMAKVAFQVRSRCFVAPYGELNLLVRQLGQSSGHSIAKNEIK
ncbi:MAG: hypothetical protein ABIH39_05760, partial [Candidatus Margulisiibacteriota bacterium]